MAYALKNLRKFECRIKKLASASDEDRKTLQIPSLILIAVIENQVSCLQICLFKALFLQLKIMMMKSSLTTKQKSYYFLKNKFLTNLLLRFVLKLKKIVIFI
jgi:hypothetical protein